MIETAKRIAQVEEYYFSKKLAEVRSLDAPEHPVINLGIGSPDLPPSEATLGALSATAQKPGSHGYQSYKGVPALRKGIADFSERIYQVPLNTEDEILPLIGSKEGIMHVSMAFLNPGDEVLIPNPGYPTYAAVSQLLGANIIHYDLKEENAWEIDLDDLRARDLSKVKIMWVNFPHMPTGKKADRKLMKELVDLAIERQFLIVNDNPYSLILNDDPFSLLSIEGAKEVGMELNSLSKSHNMAGWRIGWIAGNKHYIDAVLKVKSNMDSGMFLATQMAAVEALASGAAWFESLNQVYAQRKIEAKKIMEVLGCTYTHEQAGMFLWAKVPDSIPSVADFIDQILYETKVFITPGFIFGSNGERFIRISLCTPSEKMQEARERLINSELLKSKLFITQNLA